MPGFISIGRSWYYRPRFCVQSFGPIHMSILYTNSVKCTHIRKVVSFYVSSRLFAATTQREEFLILGNEVYTKICREN
jgi:hypothetical protein